MEFSFSQGLFPVSTWKLGMLEKAGPYFKAQGWGGLPTVGSLTVLDWSRLFLASLFCHQCKNLSHFTEEATKAC